MADMKKQASDDDLQRVAKTEDGLKILMEEERTRQKEVRAKRTNVQQQMTREVREGARLVQGEHERQKLNETCGKGKGKGNGGEGEHGISGEFGGKGRQQSTGRGR